MDGEIRTTITQVRLATRSDEFSPPPPSNLRSSDVDADHATLKAAKVDVDDEVTRWGGPVPPMFWLRDPDGNALIVVEPTT